MCEQIDRVEIRTIESFETGYLNRRVSSELKSIPRLLSLEVPGLIDSVLVLLFALYMLIKLLPNVSLALVGAAIVLIPIGIPVMKKIKKLHIETAECWSKLEGVSTFFISAQLQIRAFGAFSRMLENIRSSVRTASGTDLKNSLKGLALMVGLYFITVGGLIAFLVYAETSTDIATANAGY